MSAVASSSGKKETLYVNVINMIDILIILLVFLLTNFATSTFEDSTTLPAKMPVFGQPAETPPDDLQKKQIQNLEVRMQREKGFQIVVTISGEMPSAIDVPLKKCEEKCQKKELDEKGNVARVLNSDNYQKDWFDFEGLTAELWKIKQAYEARQDILLEAEKKLNFEEIVKAMDACRDKIVEGGGQKINYPLFPSVALTDLPF